MKSNTPVLLSVAVAIIGAAAIALLQISLDGAVLFAAGAVISGFLIQFANSAKSAPSEGTAEVDFATTTLYVGNLPYRANEMAIRTLFSEHGKVISVRLMKDKHTGKRRGFGFVEMPESDAANAIEALNEQEFQERSLKVREANERAPRKETTE
ncbi:RNA-binding protein [Psychromonas sp. B3M02]|uniref:RNA recognition motif domain-containing protein n=1 Tax=unclassified Psychromonas TaxID=2614957 RepID=UPI000DEA1D94|nr:RNA-binding protein [Psychromonas sp. B3M02]RBW47118.1 RNA-binding protein [Psychromonas sp. B3M02]